MNSLAVSGVAFVCVFGGSLLGFFLRPRLNENHLSAESKELVKMGVGLIATMTALVLGLLVASAKGSFDTQRGEIAQLSANAILLDRVLAHYGPEAKEPRAILHASVERMIGQFWPTEASVASKMQPAIAGEVLYDKIQDLTPEKDAQRSLQAQALRITVDMGQTRWLLYAQKSSAISMPFLVVVIFWLALIFTSFGLYAPRNAVTFLTLLLCAFSVSAALFLVLELDRPFEGMIQIPSEPMRNVLQQMGR
jgi:hypothetical protein